MARRIHKIVALLITKKGSLCLSETQRGFNKKTWEVYGTNESGKKTLIVFHLD
jgi:hypothetical protein